MGKVLLLGAGARRERMIMVRGRTNWAGQALVTLDIDYRHQPDIVWDLNEHPWGGYRVVDATTMGIVLEDNSFEEIHAYEVMEHLGRQGDLLSFFADFGEIYRLLEPDGRFAATVPRWESMWAWGDPGHTRIINSGSLAFLDQQQYKDQVDCPPGRRTPMADYRSLWDGDLELVWHDYLPENFRFILRAVKPSRIDR
jgi:hypothetical protein